MNFAYQPWHLVLHGVCHVASVGGVAAKKPLSVLHLGLVRHHDRSMFGRILGFGSSVGLCRWSVVWCVVCGVVWCGAEWRMLLSGVVVVLCVWCGVVWCGVVWCVLCVVCCVRCGAYKPRWKLWCDVLCFVLWLLSCVLFVLFLDTLNPCVVLNPASACATLTRGTVRPLPSGFRASD